MNKNKWLTIILAAVAAIAVIVAVVVVATSGNSNGTPEYTEGPEIGVYYYDVADGEMTLTLSGGNRFTLTNPTTNKTGSYTVDGTNITLDFLKDDDGTAIGTLDGEKFSLVLNGATIPFLKKVNYTVTFDGTDLASATIINGKTVAKPQDPTKDNHVFLGWYADAAYTQAFDFDTTTITSNVTVYAKWAVGTPDYTIDFVLGYDAEIDAVVAVSGMVYGMPTPEREGYVFGGWYASMYDDAAKLTYKCDENTVFTGNTTLYAVWYEAGNTALNAPAVSVSPNAISWTPVTGASSYKLTVVGPDGSVIIDNKTVGSTTEAFDFASNAAGEYKISVVAVASNAANNSVAAERYFANKTLSKVTNFHVENGILIFGAIENAEKYVLNINCGNPAHNHSAIDNGTSTTYYLGNCTMQKGGILITVTAKANGYADSVSKVYAYEKTLATVENIVHNAEADNISWNPVVGAANYLVTVTAGQNTYTFDNGSLTSFSIAGFTGTFTIAVTPATEGCNSPDASTVTITKTAPAAPSGLTVTGAVVSWDVVAGADSYEVNIDGKTVTVTTNSVNLAEAGLNLTNGQVYSVQVKAFNADSEGSSYCAAVKFGYNAFGDALTYNKNHVTWTPVLSANGNYEIKVNGELQQTVASVTSAKIVLTREGDNVIEVRFVSDAYTSDWASITVKAYAVEYDSRSTAGIIDIEYLAIGDVMSLPSTGFSYVGHTFAGWYNAPKGTEGNGKLYAEGAVFSGTAYTVVYAGWTPNVYDLTVNLGGNDVTNFKDGDIFNVTYSKDFFITPAVPAIPSYTFKGWYTGPDGSGVQLTDDRGNSVAPYYDPSSITIYPYLVNEAVEYTLKTDANGNQFYTASKGVKIGEITELTIVADIDGIPVTEIVASGFASCYTLEKVNIPDSIKVVGTKAFRYCRELKEVNVYEAYPDQTGTYEAIYSSYAGTLIRNDYGTMYLEYVPQAKSGDYTIPENVTHVLENAFFRTSLNSVTIPANVVSIPKYAFNESETLKTITIAERTDALTIGENAFYKCTTVETFNLPASFELDFNEVSALMNSFSTLKAINVSQGNTVYASIDGILTNGTNTILYAPKAYSGDFEVPQGITVIHSGAFYGRTNITSVVIPAWVVEIERDAFNGCTSIQTIVFKGSRSDELSIGANAFANHRALRSITFEATENTSGALDAAITIGTNAFAAGASTKSLTEININAGTNITTIGNSAFKNNTVLTDINVDPAAYVGVIGNSAFAYCSALVTIDIPATVTKIDSYAFSRCTALVNVNFKTTGATTLDIADYAFSECTKLGTILLPDHLDEFRSSAFDGCDLLKEIKVNPTNTKYTNTADGILFKRTTDNQGNLVYTDILFYPKGLAKDKGGIIDNLPETLTTIGGAAFSNNPYITEIHIPASVTLIDASAFANCSHLKTLVFKAGGTTLKIGDYAFQNCTELSLTLPAYTTEIGNYAFVGCEFTSFTVPAQVAKIGEGAFEGCKYLKSVTINTTVPLTIGNSAFAGCKELEAIALPKTLTSIGSYAFSECSALTTVTFGPTTNNGGVWTVDSNLTAIPSYAFSGCTSLEAVVIPNSVTSIAAYAFEMDSTKSSKLSKVYFELGASDTLTLEAYAFAGCTSLAEVYLPARVALLNETAPNVDWKIDAEDGNIVTMQKDVFSGCTSLAIIDVAKETGITAQYATLDGVLYNADMSVLIFCPVANVGVYVNGQPTYEIKVPTSVRLVASSAFLNVTSLKTVSFEEYATTDENYAKQLLTIGNAYNTFLYWGMDSYEYSSTAVKVAAFGGTSSSITKVNLPSHLATISESAFANKGATTVEVFINENAKDLVLENGAFAYSMITKINLPDIKSMGVGLFAESRRLADLTIDQTITEIPERFLYMPYGPSYALKSFNIPASVTTIGSYSFYGAGAFTSITFPEGITSIGECAFAYNGLTTLNIPATVSSIGASAFSGCEDLVTVTFAPGCGLTVLNYGTFQNCSSLENINVTDLPLVTFKNNVFSYCTNLKDIDFTKFTSLKDLGDDTFSGTAIEYVDLSKTQATKLTTAFKNARSMKTLILSDKINAAGTSVLQNAQSLETLQLGAKIPTSLLEKFDDRNGYIDTIIVPESNTNLVKVNGVIYDAAMTTVLFADRGADLTDYTIPATVKTIGKYAFSGANLGDFVIPDTVTSLAQYAFYKANMNSVSIPVDKITKIDSYTFRYATLSSVIWRNESNSKLTTINSYAFDHSGLVEFICPDSVTTLNASALNNCLSLNKVVLGAKIKTINAKILAGCKNVTEIYIQEGTQTINALFYNSSTKGTSDGIQVSTITIPSTVKTLGASAFNSFVKLTEVKFAEGSVLSKVDKAAFARTGLISITLPSGVSTLNQEAFQNCEALTTVDLSNTKITTINTLMFNGTTSLVSVKLPEKITSIGAKAFYNSGIQSFVAPQKLTTIGASAFEGATKLESIIFPADSAMTVLGNDTNTNIFKDTTALNTLVIPNTLTAIGAGAFENSGLTTVTLTDPDSPAKIQTIGANAFYGNTNLTSFNYLENVVSIGDYAFYNCSKMTSAPLGEKLTTLGVLSFGYCTELTSGYIPASVASMGSTPFAGLDGSKITLSPESNSFKLVEENGVKTLYDADGFTIYGVWGATGDYVVSDTVYGAAIGAFMENAITSITIPKRFGEISDMLFKDCTELASVTIEHGITYIGDYAFYNTKLATVALPGTVETLGKYSFSLIEELDNVVIPASVTEMREGVFAFDASLKNVSFEDSDEFVVMSGYTFYYCSSLDKVVLPKHFKASWDHLLEIDRANGGGSIKATEGGVGAYDDYCLPGHTFSGTAIVNAVLPAELQFLTITPAFENCANLETITFLGSSIKNGSSYINDITKSDWLAGCTKLKSVTFGFIGGATYGGAPVTYDGTFKVYVKLYNIGVREFHISSIDFTYYNSADMNWTDLGEDAVIYFDNNSYEEVANFFKYARDPKTVKMYDKDGYLLISSTENGLIVKAVDENGNTVWTNPYTQRESHYDEMEQM